MSLSIRRFFKPIATKALALLTIFAMVVWQLPSEPVRVARAGAITNASWSLSSTTEKATGVTYTHTFTAATAIPSAGIVQIEFRQNFGQPSPMPDFKSVTLTGSTAGIATATPNIFFSGNALTVNITTTAAIAAGSVTVKLNNVTNPESGGIIPTNTSTKKADYTNLDGQGFGPDANGKLTIGTIKLSGKISDESTGNGIAGVRLEVHGGPGSTSFGFWQTTTDSSGNYSFAGLTDGKYIFEMSPGGDPGSASTSTVSKYGRFDPVEVTIGTAQTINKSLAVSKKKITGTVKRAGTGTAVKGAQVNAGSMRGGFSQTTTDSSGNFTLTMAAEGQVFLMIQPPMNFGPPPGQSGPAPAPSGDTDFVAANRQLSFVKDTKTEETIALGTVEVAVPDATVKFCLKNADGTAATGGAGLADFKNHRFTPVFLDSSGCANSKMLSGTKGKIESFDPQGKYSMPQKGTTFTVKVGDNNLGTITKVENNKTVTVKVKRIDGGTERGVANAQAMVFPLDPGPPYFATTDSDGTAIVKVPDGTFRAGAMPGAAFGGGPQGPGGGGPPKDGGGPPKGVFFQQLLGIASVYAQSTSGGEDLKQLFPVTGFQKVKAGDTVTIKFDKADTSVTVKTVKPDGSLYTEGTFIRINPAAGSSSFFGGCPTAGGVGTCNVVKDTHKFTADVPPDASVVGESTTATITGSGSTVEVKVAPKNRIISGAVKNSDGTVIKDANLQVQVGAFGPSFAFGQYDPSTGNYSIPVSANKWRVGAMSENPGAGGYVPSISSTEVDTTNGNATFDITLAQLNATITGTVKDSNGNPVAEVTVVANNFLDEIFDASVGPGPGPGPGPGGPPHREEENELTQSAVTDTKGQYSIPVIPGETYTMLVNTSGLNLFPTGVVQVKPGNKETKTADITLAASDMKIEVEGNTKTGDLPEGSKVTFYSENGMINNQATLDSKGKTTLNLPSKDSKGNPMIYHLLVGDDNPEAGTALGSKETLITGEAGKTFTPVLEASSEATLPKPASVEISSSSAAAASLKEGTTEKIALSFPSGSISSGSSSEDSSSSSGGNSIAQIIPVDEELPATLADKPIGEGLELTITDSSGNLVSSFNGVVSGKIAYSSDDWKKAGFASEAEFIAKAKIKTHDPQSGQYVNVQSSDCKDGFCTFNTTHASTFAIVATTDTIAPADPTEAKATVSTGKVSLSWKNPTDSDFDKVNIYRSTSTSSIGDKLASTSSKDTTTYDDTITDKGTYYYTLKAVDTAGNESPGTDQIKAEISAVKTLPKTGKSQNQNGAAALALLIGSALSLAAIRRYGYVTRSR